MPPDAFPSPMAETLTPQQAARVLADASRYEDGLRHRTEGLTFMAWGLVASGTFVAYALASILDAPAWVFATLWAPWIAVGIAFTFALHRSVALTRERPEEAPSGSDWAKTLVVTAVVGIAYAIARPDGPLVPLGILGLSYVAMFGLNVFGSTRTGRLVGFGTGAVLAGAAATLAIAGAPIEVSGTLSMVLPGALLCSLGLWQTLRS